MRTTSRSSGGLAIFSRNHRKYLDAAIRVSPDKKRVTFRAETRWVSAARALRTSDSVPVYFAVVGGPARVEYAASLSEVLLDPRKGAARTQAALSNSLQLTRGEGLWETSRTKGRVRTLLHHHRLQAAEPALPNDSPREGWGTEFP